jgi:uncharacterized protein (TIGR02453 family)
MSKAEMGTQMFAGLPRDFTGFLEDLSQNNDKAWFDANRDRYQASVVEPLMDLIVGLGPVVEALDPPHKAVPKLNGSMRRIFRDTRFSKDKTPYHTHAHLVFWCGDHPNRSPGIHLVFHSDGFAYGAGQWGLDADQLQRFRQAVEADGDSGIEAAIASARNLGAVPDEPELARVPKGFDSHSKAADWLRRKSVVVRTQRMQYPEELFGNKAIPYLSRICTGLAEVNKYMFSVVA